MVRRAIDTSRLADEYGPALFRLCRSLAYSREEAEDLLQDTLVLALEQAEKLAQASQPQNLLYSMALRLWQSRQRKFARRRRIAAIESLDRELPGHVRDPEADYIDREELLRVRALADALPEKLRVPTALYYAMDIPIPQIAALLRLPEGTVKSRLHRARQLIKKGMKEYENDG